MSGFPLKPGTHDLAARVTVEDGGQTKIVLHDPATPDSAPLMTASGTVYEWFNAYLKAGEHLTIFKNGR